MMRLQRLYGWMVVLLAVGLVGCGEVEDDGRQPFAVRVVVDAPVTSTLTFTINHEVVDEFGAPLIDGPVMEGVAVSGGDEHTVEDAIFVLPGEQLELDVLIEFNDNTTFQSNLVAPVEVGVSGVELRLVYSEERDNWVLSTAWITPPADTPSVE